MEQALYSALVVDDNPINLRVIEKMLTGYKLHVTTAVSGKEALEKITSKDYNIVFMDHLMPEMDGIETLHAIRNMAGEYYRKVPVVALTANEIAGAKERFLEEGFQDFIQKPLKTTTLEPVLNRFLVQGNRAGVEMASATEEKETSVTEEWERALIADGLDVKTALLYCNGKESYLEILQDYCRIAEHMEGELERAYDIDDWGNYTILVHGMKSALRSIGATVLSEEAKLLEAAGKERRIQDISEHHRDFLLQYKKLFLKLQANPLFGKSVQATGQEAMAAVPEEPLKDLSEEEFCKLIDDMEDAAYALDVERFLEFAVELKNYRYKGTPLLELSELLQRKIQKADYLSAVETMKQWKQR